MFFFIFPSSVLWSIFHISEFSIMLFFIFLSSVLWSIFHISEQYYVLFFIFPSSVLWSLFGKGKVRGRNCSTDGHHGFICRSLNLCISLRFLFERIVSKINFIDFMKILKKRNRFLFGYTWLIFKYHLFFCYYFMNFS